MAHVPEHEEGSGLGWYTKRNARHPFYPPLGLNAGLLLIDVSSSKIKYMNNLESPVNHEKNHHDILESVQE